jgi:transcription initiation factor TFIIIB Brf1 subunit/transcription initiation factor TFIIB
VTTEENFSSLTSSQSEKGISYSTRKVFKRARDELSRLCIILTLPKHIQPEVFEKFKQIYSVLNKGTKYKNPNNLIPLTLYFFLKTHKISISEQDLLYNSYINSRDFYAFKYQILHYNEKSIDNDSIYHS